MDDLPPGTPVTLHGFVERRDPETGSYLVAIRPVGMGYDDPGPIQQVWVAEDEFTVASTDERARTDA